MFQNLNDEADNDDDDAMADVSAAPKTTKSQLQPAQNLVADQHADIDVDDDIS